MGNQESKAEAMDLSQAGVTAEERHQLIAKSAYFRAERQGFTPGSELQDWLEAEAEIEATYGKMRPEAQSIDT